MATRNRQPVAAEQFANWAATLRPDTIPAAVRTVAENAVLDFAGLCLAARHSDYVRAVGAAWDARGDCTAIGHTRRFDAAAAAVVNGTAAHGEDYDDTFEGSPVHVGAVIIPAVLAAAERYGLTTADVLRGIAVGGELICRMTLVAPTAIHRAGFHPTAVIGTLGAAAGVSAALGLAAEQMVNALGVAGSMASGIIEYLAEGTWTKRLHAGWAAQSGLRAALLGAQGFLGPRTVLEGRHGFFFAFGVPAVAPDFSVVSQGLGEVWRLAGLAFKPYACGTMAQPFIDCAIRLAEQGVEAAAVREIRCKVGEGTVHRLWEPLAEKHHPSTPYAAKFSVPYCIAVAFHDRAAGLEQFTAEKIRDPDILGLAAKVRYEIDPQNAYPRHYTGHLRLSCEDGRVYEAEQPHFRGGVQAPLSRAELAAKFYANAAFGGFPRGRAERLEAWCTSLFEAPDVAALGEIAAEPQSGSGVS